jgi:dihydroorotate dehydrogenase (NAD+) catalytic subunit
VSLLPVVVGTGPGTKLEISGYWLASGILGVSAASISRVYHSGADVVVTKSIGRHPRRGHSGPILAESNNGLLNAVGLTNPGIEEFSRELNSIDLNEIPVVISIFDEKVEGMTELAVRACDPGPRALELNLSCPHAEISQIAHSPELTYEFVKGVTDVVDCPVFVKITPNASNIIGVGLAAQRAGADAVVAVNTLRAMTIDILQRKPVLGNSVGGLSGPPLFPVAVRCIYDLYSALDIPIIGVGGVCTWKDAVEMHLAGASAIQIGTAVMKSLEVFREIKTGVGEYLAREGFRSTSEIVGLAGGKR